LSQLSQFEEAESLYLRCLSQLEEEDHSGSHEYDDDFLTILSNLAYLYSTQEEYHHLAAPLWRACVVKRKDLIDLVRHYRSLRHHPPPVHSRDHDRSRGEDDSLLKNELFSFGPSLTSSLSSPLPQDNPLCPVTVCSWTREEYQLFKLHQTIRWLCALFNLCAISIERGWCSMEEEGKMENIPDLLQLCEETCESLWEEEDENRELKDRIRSLRQQMEAQLSSGKQLRPLWATIYEKTPQLPPRHQRWREGLWDPAVVMDPTGWLDGAWKPNASNWSQNRGILNQPSLPASSPPSPSQAPFLT
jgi:hypothetical protein